MSEYAGHKTFYEGHGRFRHEPLTREEADTIFEQIEASAKRRQEKYPDEQTCVNAIFDALQRLEELGWKRAEYAPADGKIKKAIELWSTGIHDAYCDQTDSPVHLPRKWWWGPGDDGDLWPMRPILYKELESPPQDART